MFVPQPRCASRGPLAGHDPYRQGRHVNRSTAGAQAPVKERRGTTTVPPTSVAPWVQWRQEGDLCLVNKILTKGEERVLSVYLFGRTGLGRVKDRSAGKVADRAFGAPDRARRAAEGRGAGGGGVRAL